MFSTKLMAVLNVTPDSYFQPSRIEKSEKNWEVMLQERIEKFLNEGADILDIGGESTRPGAQSVSFDEELSRILPALQVAFRYKNIPISIDTMKPEIAQIAIEHGASIINDVSGLQDERMIQLLEKNPHVQAVLMHMKGSPKTMQQNLSDDHSVVQSVTSFFNENLDMLEKRGVDRKRIILDPGIGFGKTLSDNLELMKACRHFQALGCKLLYGISRKTWLGKLLNRDVDDRLPGTLAASSFLIEQGTHILRVHDVQAHRDFITTLTTLR